MPKKPTAQTSWAVANNKNTVLTLTSSRDKAREIKKAAGKEAELKVVKVKITII